MPLLRFQGYLRRRINSMIPSKGRGKKKRFYLGKSPKLWVGGGQESQIFLVTKQCHV